MAGSIVNIIHGSLSDTRGGFEVIRRVEEEEREAAELIGTICGANSDGLSTHMEA